MFSELKDTIRSSILPLVKWIPLSPNSLTIIGLLISIWAAVVFATGNMIAGALLILFSGFFDMIDGAVARAKNRMSVFGAVLDSVCDRYADAIVFAGIIYGSVTGTIVQPSLFSVPMWFWVIFAVIGSYMVSYVRSRAESAGVSSMNIGIAERPERMIILVLGSLSGYLVESIVLIVILTHITMVQRLLYAKKELS
ncbi:MAG: archaetidylinositol phosphate synthase [Methanolobus sp.]|jgi:archaetidylinositol phosphate synthase|uniref:Archaetidylinositol phosphate synthase n=1 Tax=Methanolobus tindarius DSM 2278 TaxID=1090322 RepID=W9DNT5_METTI|nr:MULTISPECIES: CDP-alcohol phosphatidyltransferase family protein [Methanolobus]ETA66673.1 phosphatidylglycerophosphate synthase [Methanolobus tindarius DSM 2278]MDI3485935.1 archaetidylinositol phosphate synthase [Methanolobus sp.]MDK2832628.1 archaetidylinositol phosphate synthase [Methanolobus sp.]MDK2940419.1 archaetidylinositol phosphate synthase [Methanolobus sp.]